MRRLVIPVTATLALALADCGDVSPNDLRDPTCSTSSFNVEGRTFTTFGTSADARKVDAFLHQVGEAIIHHQIDGDVRISIEEAAQPRHHMQSPEHHRA